MPSRWQDGFFKDLAVEMWKRAIPPEQTRLEVEYLEKMLRPPNEGCLLDVCCGHGRHAVPLAGRGYRVTGVDSSKDALGEARKVGAGSVTWELRRVDLDARPGRPEAGGSRRVGARRALLARLARADPGHGAGGMILG